MAACVTIAVYSPAALQNQLAFPVFKDALLNLGWFYPLFGAFVIVGAGNSVNMARRLPLGGSGAAHRDPPGRYIRKLQWED